jgi:hypothetical protein
MINQIKMYINNEDNNTILFTVGIKIKFFIKHPLFIFFIKKH